MSARYIPDTAKALEVILWLASSRPGIDVYHVVKCAYYADKRHLNAYGRPIAGDWYEADQYGPKGQCVYGLMRGRPIEVLALENNGRIPLTVTEHYIVIPEREPNVSRLSDSDRDALSWALTEYADLSFDELLELSHREEAYLKA
ncbi:MAG: Panacea domain-containing protein, partial [Stellaceae bacterium]